MEPFNRQKFFLQAGTTISTAVLLQYCLATNSKQRKTFLEDEELEDQSFKEPILNCILFGLTAPNPHNTQAWKFKILNSKEMLLFIDDSRILPITDPTTRQIHIAQGTFLECMRIGASSLSFETKIQLFPEGKESNGNIGKKPIAKVSLLSKQIAVDPLFPYLKDRRTVRTAYEGDLLQEKEFRKILEDSSPKFSEVQSFLAQTKIDSLIKECMDALRIEVQNVRTADESRLWFRFSQAEVNIKRDGISLADQGVTGFQKWILETFFMGPEPEKFHNKTGVDQFLSGYEKKIKTAKGIVIWKTKKNEKMDWVQVGIDYVRFQLAAIKSGFVIHPMSQILQEYPEMNAKRESFEQNLGIQKNEKIQMVARIGRSEYRYFTPRRNLKSMLT